MMRETLVFSNPRLLEKLRKREIVATIRSIGYVTRNGIKEGKIVRIFYRRGKKREALGFARIKRIREITYGLLTDIIASMCGYDSLDELRKWVRIYMRFRELRDNTKLYLIEFEWVEGGTLDYYIPIIVGKKEIIK